MLQLPDIAETQDPIIKKLIIAMQELSDQVGTRDTIIFSDMNEQIKGLRSEMKEGFASLTTEMKQTRVEMKQTRGEMQQTREETVDLLKQITENTKK